MSSAFVFSAMIALLAVGYVVYGNFIEKKLVAPNDGRETPAVTKADGVDYVTSKPQVLFGHHFASIAGAGPIVGPILAALYFGWAAVAIWIVVGAIAIGAVHDYMALMISVRQKGDSMANITEKALNARAKVMFSIFLYLALVLVVAVFAAFAAKTLIAQPKVVLPTFGILPIAAAVGYLIYRKGVALAPVTIVALAGLFGLIWMGQGLPIAMPASLGKNAMNAWIVVLMIYALMASALPVWILLQPRDYLSTYVLFLGMALGFGGVMLAHQPLAAPAFHSASASVGYIWPMLFITVACGACSGFHCLVAAGTSARQLAKESHGKPVAFGGMILEGGLAALALVCVSAGLYWKAAPAGGDAALVFQTVMGPTGGGPIAAFGKGFGSLVHQGMGFIPMSLATTFAILMLKTFIMTTLDTATRLGRFIVDELVGPIFPPARNRWIASAAVALPALALAWGDNYNLLWPVFGAANQLIASLALFVISSYLVGVRKPSVYTFVPAVFMLVTTIAALIWQAYDFIANKSNNFLGGACVVLTLLAFTVFFEAIGIVLRLRRDPEALNRQAARLGAEAIG